MKYTELMKQPNGILFYEDDITTPVIMQKVETTDNDIIIRSFDKDFDECRLGLREMDECDRNSKDYHVYTKDELNILNNFWTIAYLTN